MKTKTSLIISIILLAIPWLIYFICYLTLRSATVFNGISPENVLSAVFAICRFISIFPFVLFLSSFIKFIKEFKREKPQEKKRKIKENSKEEYQ